MLFLTILSVTDTTVVHRLAMVADAEQVHGRLDAGRDNRAAGQTHNAGNQSDDSRQGSDSGRVMHRVGCRAGPGISRLDTVDERQPDVAHRIHRIGLGGHDRGRTEYDAGNRRHCKYFLHN